MERTSNIIFESKHDHVYQCMSSVDGVRDIKGKSDLRALNIIKRAILKTGAAPRWNLFGLND